MRFFIVTGAGGENIKIWDLSSGRLLHVLEEHELAPVRCLQYNHQVIIRYVTTVRIVMFDIYAYVGGDSIYFVQIQTTLCILIAAVLVATL